MMCQFGNDCRAQNSQHGLLGIGPDRVRGAEGFPLASCAGDQAEVQGDRALNGLNYSAQGSFASGRQHLKTAGLSPAGNDESGAAQCL